MPDVRIRLLGGFAATVDGEPVSEQAWRLKKARELVKLLALARGHRLHREQAMDRLWPDRGPSAAANNLNQALHVARRALGAETIESRDETLLLTATVDVEELEAAAAAARRIGTPAAYRAALDLYGGELLPENRYDDWAEARRDELADLHDELTRELAALGGDAAVPLARLPAATSSFVGREHELAELRSLLGHTRLLTLAGPGGAGKTRLALELARHSESSYGGGAVLAELAPVLDPELVPAAVAAAVDVRALPGRSLVDSLVDFLAPRELLLVLDNCEHVLGASAAIVDVLLRDAPRLTVVVTTREPLRVPGEVVFRVPSLAIPDPEQPPSAKELLRYEAARLFDERATAAAPGFAIDDGNAADVARICFRLDGLPLALELAAARIGALTPAAIAERLDDRFRLLRAGSRTAPTRQQTLEATLQWSHDLLEPEEAALLRRLGAFVGGFTLEAAETVCSDAELERAEVVDVLARLVEKSLVAAEDDESGGRRYRLLETIRAYARERLSDAAEGDAFADRHAEWAIALAERDPASLDDEEANLRAALDTLLASDPEAALRLCAALRTFWLRRIELDEAQRRLEDALERAPARTALRAVVLHASAAIDYRAGSLERGRPRAEEALAIARELGDKRLEWRTLQFLAEFGFAYDDPDESGRWLAEALQLARSEGFADAEAVGVYSLGVVEWLAGSGDAAIALFEESLAKFRELDDSPETIPSPVNIAETRSAEGPGLRLVFEETLQPFVDITCRAAAGYVLANLAALVRASGDLERARRLLDESLAHFERDDDDSGRASVFVRRAYLELDAGRTDAAAADLEAALAIRRRANDRRGVGLALTGLGQVATTVGDYDAAERRLTESCEIFRRAGDRWGLTSALWRTAELAFTRGRPDEAERPLEEARRIVASTRRAAWIAFTLTGLAEVALQRGDRERAATLLSEARRHFADDGDPAAVASVDERIAALAKAPQSRRKAAARTTSPSRTTKGRRR